ncbi:sodium-dependent transporter [Porticoccaceae bacterium]|nr:sodium-dependent transporter [Porticoccaceae bacterium]
MRRGEFSSTFTFVLAAAGSAVGLGNIWGFPTNAAENGGAAFLLMYLILAFLLAYPALMAELIIGRHTRANMVTALDSIATSQSAKKLGRFTGYAGMLTASLILSFYGIVAGWMLGSMAEPVASTLGLDAVGAWLTEFGTARNISLTALFMLLTGLIINAGVEQGIEKWSRRLMPSLLILLVALIAYVLTREGALEGLQHYLVPDFSQMANPDLIVSALGQAFFSMSLGVGTMLIYGSYIRSDANLPVVGSLVTLTDTGIAFLAGLLILPAMFVAQNLGVAIYGDDGSLVGGPGLIFQVLPTLFKSMGGVGLFVGFAFFVLMSIAAVTSSISMLEVPVSYAVENHNISRKRSTLWVSSAIFAISVAICLNFEIAFDVVISLTTEWAQPLISLLICLFAGWVFYRNSILNELKQGNPDIENSLFWKLWPLYVRLICPALIAIIIYQSL